MSSFFSKAKAKNNNAELGKQGKFDKGVTPMLSRIDNTRIGALELPLDLNNSSFGDFLDRMIFTASFEALDIMGAPKGQKVKDAQTQQVPSAAYSSLNNASSHEIFPVGKDLRSSRTSSAISQEKINGNNFNNENYFGKVKIEYAAKKGDELSLEEEDIVKIVAREKRPGYLYGMINSVCGWFPENVVDILSPDEAELENLVQHTLQDATSVKNDTLFKSENDQLSKQNSSYVSNEPLQKKISKFDVKLETGIQSFNMSQTLANLRSSRFPGQRPLWVETMGGPKKVMALGISKQEIKRQEIILEIICTEADYVEDLEIICEV